jgi:uncharacterized protein (UPF0335 family)
MAAREGFGMSDAKSRMSRILNHLAEIDEIKTLVREIYAEEKAAGGDKTAMGSAIAIIRKRDKVGRAAVEERDDLVATYLNAFEGSSHTHAGAREMPSGAEAGSAVRGGAPILEEA